MGLDPVGGFRDNEALIREAPQVKVRDHGILLDRRIFYLKEKGPDGGGGDAFGKGGVFGATAGPQQRRQSPSDEEGADEC